MIQDGRPQGRRSVLRQAGKDATEGKTGRRQAAAFPFLAKLGMGRLETPVSGVTIHSLPFRAERGSSEKYSLKLYYPPLAGRRKPQLS